MAPKTKPKAIEDGGQSETFSNLEVYKWDVGGVAPPREYCILNVPLNVLKDWIFVQTYDHMKNVGWQREVSDSHARNLSKAMDGGDYTPTVWVAGVDAWHVENWTYVPGGKSTLPKIHLKVNEEHKLLLTDGNHRNKGVGKLLKFCETSKDATRVAKILASFVTIQIHLNPTEYRRDFIRLQMGKSVNRSQLISMKVAEKDIPPEQAPHARIANEAANLLSKDKHSHLYEQVAFDSNSGKRALQYSSLVASDASSLATTLYGGAKIAKEFKKHAKWLAERYVDAFRAVEDYVDEDGASICFHASQKLCPTLKGGHKYGTHLIIGIGNCLAWRLGFLGKQRPDAEDLAFVTQVVESTLDGVNKGKGAATSKREDMGAFARAYFADMETTDSGEEVLKIDGVPAELVRLTSPSTWSVDGEFVRAFKKENPDFYPARIGPDGQPIKPGRPKHKPEDDGKGGIAG